MTRGLAGWLVTSGLGRRPGTDRDARPGATPPPDLPRGWVGWVVVSVPTLLGLIVAHSVDDGRSTLDAVAVASQFALLAVAVGFAALQHQVPGSRAGWLSAALTVPPVSVSLVAVVAAADPQLITIEGYAALHLTGGALSLLWVVLSGSRRRAPAAPVVAGFLGGVVTAAVCVTVSLSTGATTARGPAWIVLLAVSGGCLTGLGVLAIRSLSRQRDLGPWVRLPLVAGGGVLVVAALVSTAWPDAGAARHAATALHLLAWVCFLAVGARLLSRVNGRGPTALGVRP